MTEGPDVWTIASVADAARARAAVAQVTREAPARERARLLASLTARLRRLLRAGGAGELRLRVRRAAPGTAPGSMCGCGPSAPPRRARTTGPTSSAPAPPDRPRRPDTGPPLPESLLRTDADTAAVLRLLDGQEHHLRLHREELHQTDQGVLALHSELEAAALVQRDLLEAERAARAESERARRLLAFLGDAGAAITASSAPRPSCAACPSCWCPPTRSASTYGSSTRRTTPNTPARTGTPRRRGGRRPDRPSPARRRASRWAARRGRPPARRVEPAATAAGRPLTGRHPIGVLTLTAPGPRFDADTSVMLVELVSRGVALDNARRYERYRDTAEVLQRAQLTELPARPGLLLAARYLPATRGLNIGGDWYDAFVQPDGGLLAVIGDVTGHGLHAAVVMGRLRTALRAYAVESDSPAAILTRLHRMLRHQQPELYATALIARLRPGEPEVVWASAATRPPWCARPTAPYGCWTPGRA
ncbi:PP2C family protein-serine/threonine phosphatase [Streptomyces nogalater]